MQTSRSKPAFGEAVLSNCELEQIHLAGSIQPHGALLVVSEPGYEVVQASENAAQVLGVARVLPGSKLVELDCELVLRVSQLAEQSPQEMPAAARCRLSARDVPVDVLVHRPYSGGLVVEIEPGGAPVDLSDDLATALQRISLFSSIRTLCDETATTLKNLTGYDRVMVYRFDDEGHGEVFSEEREPELEAFYGNRYPASDIPQIARRLYERNRVRTLVDVSYTPVRLSPRISPITGQELDMSMCYLRSMSPIHIQYLKNMGVAATFVVSLMVGGRLWGLIACHHYAPRVIHYELRAVCDLLAEAVGVRIAALEGFARARTGMAVRRLEQSMLKSIAHVGDWRSALFDNPQTLFEPLDASGVALLLDGEILTTGGSARESAAPIHCRVAGRQTARSGLRNGRAVNRRARPGPFAGCKRHAGRAVVQISGRLPDLVQTGAGQNRYLGGQPDQAGRRRGRSIGSVAPVDRFRNGSNSLKASPDHGPRRTWRSVSS